MYIVKTNIGNEKRNAFNAENSFLSALIHNNYKQESKDQQVHTRNLSISFMCTHVDPFCRVIGLLPSRYSNSIVCSLIKRINLPMESTVA